VLDEVVATSGPAVEDSVLSPLVEVDVVVELVLGWMLVEGGSGRPVYTEKEVELVLALLVGRILVDGGSGRPV